MELSNWAREFVKARDAIRKTLVEVKGSDTELTFVHKHKVHHFLISPKLQEVSARDWYTVVCDQTQENVAFLVDHWESFLQPHLSVIFVNLASNQYWQISPKVHASIADPETLRVGIETMASEVPY